MLSQFFILSTRGDTIIKRDCKLTCHSTNIFLQCPVRFDLKQSTSEVFFRKVKFWPGDPPPTFVRIHNLRYTTIFPRQTIYSLSFRMLTVSITSSQRSSASTSWLPPSTMFSHQPCLTFYTG